MQKSPSETLIQSSKDCIINSVIDPVLHRHHIVQSYERSCFLPGSSSLKNHSYKLLFETPQTLQGAVRQGWHGLGSRLVFISQTQKFITGLKSFLCLRSQKIIFPLGKGYTAEHKEIPQLFFQLHFSIRAERLIRNKASISSKYHQNNVVYYQIQRYVSTLEKYFEWFNVQEGQGNNRHLLDFFFFFLLMEVLHVIFFFPHKDGFE